jgi:hypothetical protein
MRKTIHEVREEIEKKRLWHQRQAEWSSPDGSNIVGDHDEDYVFDALFDVPNR